MFAERAPQGEIRLTALRLRGASTYRPGNLLADLARFLRDRAGLQVRIREQVYNTFLSPDLLEDPVHFLFQCEGGWKDRMVYFSDEERGRLGEYLRNGGFLFVEGDNRFLREMIGQLRIALRGEGELFEIPAAHPLYHSFYDFERGFPGELKGGLEEIPVKEWTYPVASSAGGEALGLWGIEVEGRLAAVFSDLGLLRDWAPDPAFGEDSGGDPERPLKSPALAAATNLVMYALRR